jgi:hypothetical protein
VATWGAVLLCVGAVMLGASPANAVEDALAAAQRAYGDVDYAKCKDNADKALNVPADKPSRVDAWRLIGLCSAALNDTDKARDAFKHMLAIDRDARLPDGLSPRFTSSFREAKGAFVTGSPLAFTIVSERVDGGVRTIRIKLVDELDLVQKIAWHSPNGAQGPPVKAAPQQELQLPADVDVTVIALDQGGGEVAVLLLPAKKAEAPAPTAPQVKADDQPFPWLAVGGIAAGVVVLAAAGAITYAVLAPPQQVTLKSDVVFGP